MKKILKYRLPRDGETKTINACVLRWLDIKEQYGWPHIWAVVDDCGPVRSYEFTAWGTGWDYLEELDGCEYMGTAIDGMGYVWHYFMNDNTYLTTLDYESSVASTIDYSLVEELAERVRLTAICSKT